MVIFPPNSIMSRVGESQVQVSLTPLDVRTAPPPTSSVRFDGNAYRVEAIYATSRQLVALRQPATMVLRYPTHATVLMRSSGLTWTSLPTNRVEATLQVFAMSDQLGVFVAATSSPYSGSGTLYRLVTLAAVAVVAVLLVRMRRSGLALGR